MSAAPGFGSPRLRDSRIQQLALDLAITLRICSLRIWCSPCERRAFRAAMRAEAFKWRRCGAPGW
jgi:hypothetical protein